LRCRGRERCGRGAPAPYRQLMRNELSMCVAVPLGIALALTPALPVLFATPVGCASAIPLSAAATRLNERAASKLPDA